MNRPAESKRGPVLIYALILSLLLTLPSTLTAQDSLGRYQSVQDALTKSGQLRGSNGPSNVQWIDGGERYSYMTRNAENGNQEIRVYDPAADTDELIFDGSGLVFPDDSSAFSYQSFQWSEDAEYLLFQTRFRSVYRRSGISDYYLYSLKEKSLKLVADDARTAELSPNGKMVGYERGGNMFVMSLADMQETQMTFNEEQYIYNGRYGWVYEEEFGLPQAWKWSPDSKHIAFWQTDETEVEVFEITDYSTQYPEYTQIPYPKVGTTNPTVKIGTIDVDAAEVTWMDLEAGDGYIPRVYWTSKANTLAIVHLNRPQTHLKLFMHDIENGEGTMIMEEQADAWIDIFDFFAGIMDYFFFPQDREEFFWISDRNGWSHIYRYNYKGELLNQVTEGEWEVTYVHAVDSRKKTIYYTSTEASPLERHLYSIRFNGKRKKQLTDTPGRHNTDMAPNAQFYIDRYSNVALPTQVDLRDRKGKLLKKLEDNSAVTKFTESHVYAPAELMTFTTPDGQPLDISVIKPVDFDPSKSYPLFLSIYGGPGAQSVYNQFAGSAWSQYLAQEGYVVASVNNRGSGGYGRDFEKMVYKNLGEWESLDFVETANFLAQKEWVDGERMAIRGHSYGGYMTLMTMAQRPGTFSVGISGAPVTDWRLYDTIYAERYMGLLGENTAGYDSSSVMSYVGDMAGKVFLAHSAMDDNVHMQNTMQFMTAATNASKDIDLRIYPPGAHGVAYNSSSYFLLYTAYTDYLNRWLK